MQRLTHTDKRHNPITDTYTTQNHTCTTDTQTQPRGIYTTHTQRYRPQDTTKPHTHTTHTRRCSQIQIHRNAQRYTHHTHTQCKYTERDTHIVCHTMELQIQDKHPVSTQRHMSSHTHKHKHTHKCTETHTNKTPRQRHTTQICTTHTQVHSLSHAHARVRARPLLGFCRTVSIEGSAAALLLASALLPAAGLSLTSGPLPPALYHHLA